MESDTTRGNAGWRVTRGSRPSPHRQPAANEGQGTGGCRSVSSVKERRERAIHVTERRTPFCTHVPRASRLRYSTSLKSVTRSKVEDGSPNTRSGHRPLRTPNPCVRRCWWAAARPRAEETGVRSSANRTLCPLSILLSGAVLRRGLAPHRPSRPRPAYYYYSIFGPHANVY